MNTIPTTGFDVMYCTKYGSRLYGTSTPSSDHDYKMVYLPNIDDLLLGRRLVSTKGRFDAEGKKITDDQASMPPDGVEIEYIPFQTFVRDFVQGQTYAVEIAYAVLQDGPSAPSSTGVREHQILLELVQQFANSEVYSMVSFAQKQTFDYVKRAERLATLRELESVLEKFDSDLRLDSVVQGVSVLDTVSELTGAKTSTSKNQSRVLRTLELNGRSYLETTTIEHVLDQVQKLIAKFGHRVEAATEHMIDWKSISHAVRVYQQSIELLDTGFITFPRKNSAELLRIKNGEVPFVEVTALLNSLDAEVLEKIKSTTFRKRTADLVHASEQFLLRVLRELYLL